ncbi:MAG: conserved hypothetical protein [Marine Group I thaumarchaeote]|nr:MAG: conserved hypothetical protein [Marine Group I thaumarchaeote]
MNHSSQQQGYVCAPYLHNHKTVEMKEAWERSTNVENMYFVTATFSPEGQAYFSPYSNQYILAKFKDRKKILDDITKYKDDKASLIFTIGDDLFEREVSGSMKFVSFYYLQYSESTQDISEVASSIAKREKVSSASIAQLDSSSNENPKFTFPYKNNIVVLEVSSNESHQSDNKYCEKTRRDVCRKGITMVNLVSLSILDKLK